MNILDKVEIVKNLSGHPFMMGDEVTIFRIFSDNTYDVCGLSGNCWRVFDDEIVNKTDISMKQMTQAVLDTANRLLKSQNEVTTLEIKAEVIKTHSQFFWTQAFVSATMDDAYTAGMYTFRDTVTGGNTHRVYSSTGVRVTNVKPKVTTGALAKTGVRKVTPRASVSPKPKKVTAPKSKTIGKTKALELMENNRGHFFTATFVDKKGVVRIMNCQYLKDQTYSKLGYVKVREAIKAKVQKNAPKKRGVTVKDDTIRQINLQTLMELKIAGNSYKVK